MTLHPVRPPLRGGKNNRDTYRGFRPPRRTPPPATHVCPLRGNNEPKPTLRCLFTYLWEVVVKDYNKKSFATEGTEDLSWEIFISL
ncbi:hypothetical protein LCGC14_3043010 [marine sediment metagenome]|uniref:Uncharacterized protein n=1 Tax=marine sediment metagenome TaxID=412755 RepID=A0A0F8ZEY4_9ZZZZ